MKILLDTHSFIWWATNDLARFSQPALAAYHHTGNTLYLSTASIWEMQIKAQLGKLQFSPSLKAVIQQKRQVNKIKILYIQMKHIYTPEQLPFHHCDPFDRLLIAQALHENIAIVTHDSEFAKYAVNIIW